MKKFKILCYCLVCMLVFTACGNHSSAGSSVSSSDTSETPMDNTSTNEETPSPDLTSNDAYQLVSEKIDTESVSITSKDSVTLDGQKYFLFYLEDKTTGMHCNYAVNYKSGEISVYEENGQRLLSYSQSPFNYAKTDAECDWNGTFSQNQITLELRQGDPQSFEFDLTGNDADLFGVAYIHGNTAYFNDKEAGISLNFLYNNDGSIEITGNQDYAGNYQPA